MSLDLTVHHNWNKRPKDERFQTLSAMGRVASNQKGISRVGDAKLGDLRFGVDAGSLVLTGKSGVPVNPTNYAFGQICRYAGAPAGFIGDLPSQLACDVLNDRLQAACGSLDDSGSLVGGKDVRLLMAINGERTLRAVNSPKYSRFWDADLINAVQTATDGSAWTNPMCYAFDDKQGRPAWGGPLEPGGLYRGDRDMMILLQNKDVTIDMGNGDVLHRFVVIGNSEVGARSFWMMDGWVRLICNNLMLHGTSDVLQTRVRHIGANIADRCIGELSLAFSDVASASALEDEATLKASKNVLLGTDQASVVASVVKATKLPVKTAVAAYKLAEEWQSVDGSPLSAWGQSNGLTRYAQLSQWADSAETINAAAGQLLRVTVQRVS